MTPNLLIVFYRNPVLGKVKTRIAATMGDEAALAIYLRLAAYTRTIVGDLECDKAVFYSEQIETEDQWDIARYQKHMQRGADLGKRMSGAFQWAFSKGYESVCLIGSDCLDLTTDQLAHSFEILSLNDVVLGPAKDGGYYLIGMNELHKKLFINKPWSSHLLLEATLEEMEKLKLDYQMMPVLSDIDTESDLPKSFKVPQQKEDATQNDQGLE